MERRQERREKVKQKERKKENKKKRKREEENDKVELKLNEIITPEPPLSKENTIAKKSTYIFGP